MFITELDTFVRKFHQLWNDGFTAHLDLDTQAGNAWVGLRLNLGQVPGPVHGEAPPSPNQHFRDQTSKQRRRARREAARLKRAEEAAAEDVGEEKNVVDTEQVLSVAMHAKPIIQEKKEATTADEAEQATYQAVSVADEVCPDNEFFDAEIDNDGGDEDIEVQFISNYAEEDVIDSFKEMFEDNLLPCLPQLVSRERVEQRSADHLCKVKMRIRSRKKAQFSWPELKGYPDFFKNVKVL